VRILDNVDITLIKELEKGLPFQVQPFSSVGERVGISEDEVLIRIRQLKKTGVIRKIKARINQRKIGVIANALVAWNVTDADREKAGHLLSAFPGVTHCYERVPIPGKWEYSLYTVHHGYDKEIVTEEIKSMAEETGIEQYVIIFSTEECKRVPHIRIGISGENL